MLKAVVENFLGVRNALRFFREPSFRKLRKALRNAEKNAASLAGAANPEFAEFVSAWHEMLHAIKDAAYSAEVAGNMASREVFEYGWGAQSVQFAIDCLPELHRVLKKYYRRNIVLEFVDVGAGSGAGANLFAMLHSDHYVYSRFNVAAIDHMPARKRWVEIMYPKLAYEVIGVDKLPEKKYDIVYCSHVIEHVKDPDLFLDQLIRICKGFLFVYAPYKESPLSKGHRQVITEDLFLKRSVESINIIHSMAWHPDDENSRCILAVLDCRMKVRHEHKPIHQGDIRVGC